MENNKQYNLTQTEDNGESVTTTTTTTEHASEILRMMKLAGIESAHVHGHDESIEEEVEAEVYEPTEANDKLDLDDYSKKSPESISKQKKSIQPTLGDNPLEYSLDENEIYEAMVKEFDSMQEVNEEEEDVNEAQSPAQKAAFAKMLAAKNGKKDEAVEEETEELEEAQSPAQKAAFAKMLAAKNGKKDEAVEETDELTEETISEDEADPKPEVGMNFTRVRWANPPMGELEPDDQNEDEYMHGTIIKVSTDHIVVKFFDDTVQKIHVGGIEYDKEENKFYSEENGTSWDTGENDKQDRLAKLAGIQKEEIATDHDPKWDAEEKERRIEGDKARKEDDNNSSIQNFKPMQGRADWAKSVTDGTRKHFQTEIEDSSNFEIGSLSSPYTAATYLQELKRSIDEAFTKHGTPVPERIANIFNKLLEYSKNWPLQMKNRKIGPSTGYGNHMQFADNGDEEYIAELFIEPMLNEFFTAGEEIGMSMDESISEDCGCGHGSDCDCSSDCDCGCNAVEESVSIQDAVNESQERLRNLINW